MQILFSPFDSSVPQPPQVKGMKEVGRHRGATIVLNSPGVPMSRSCWAFLKQPGPRGGLVLA